jgi:predicted metal-dependent hydrolase
METFGTYFFIIIIIIILFSFINNKKKDISLVKSSLDGDEYLVRNLPDKIEASNRLAYIRSKLTEVVKKLHPSINASKNLYSKYIQNDKKLEKEISFDEFDSSLNQLLQKYNDVASTFSESTPDAKYTSYSVNKGEQLVFCLRLKKEGDRLVPKNTILFVALHELSHLMTKTIGHGKDFWNNFRFILKVAIDYDIYKSVDFNNNPAAYCGMKITDSPYIPNK